MHLRRGTRALALVISQPFSPLLLHSLTFHLLFTTSPIVVPQPSSGKNNKHAVVVQLMSTCFSLNQLYKNKKMAKLVLFSTA